VAETHRSQESLMPRDAKWFKNKVGSFNPESNTVTLDDGTDLKYDTLVVSLGLELKPGKIKGLEEALHNPNSNVTSNYFKDTCSKTWDVMQKFKGGTAIFTHPPGAIKCAGAPQKIMYLAEEYWTKNLGAGKAKLEFHSATPSIFAVPKYAESLKKVIARKGIDTFFETSLTEIDGEKGIAWFSTKGGDATPKEFDFAHITPPQGPYDVIAKSPLADQDGWLDVDKHHLQSTKFDNVFGLGDCTNTPNSKTLAAVAEQNEAVFNNIVSNNAGRHKDAWQKYNGYASCPLVTGNGSLILAEFDYDKKPIETFPFDQGEERATMYYLKRDVMPKIYWDMMTKGTWGGPKQFRKVLNPMGSG